MKQIKCIPVLSVTARLEGNSNAVQEFVEQANESKEHASIFALAAKRFKGLAKVEQLHANRYQQALADLKRQAE